MNAAPWDTSGPSMLGTQFYTPGWSPRPPQVPRPQKAQKREIDVQALMEYRHSDKTIQECARRFGIGKEKVVRLLAEPVRTRVKRLTFDKERALQMYLDGKSARAIGKLFGFGRQPILDYIKSLNLSPEQVSQARANMKAKRVRNQERKVSLTPSQDATFRRLGGRVWLLALLDSMGDK